MDVYLTAITRSRSFVDIETPTISSLYSDVCRSNVQSFDYWYALYSTEAQMGDQVRHLNTYSNLKK
jgi:hypothetical protein